MPRGVELERSTMGILDRQRERPAEAAGRGAAQGDAEGGQAELSTEHACSGTERRGKNRTGGYGARDDRPTAMD